MTDKERYIEFLESVGFKEYFGKTFESIPDNHYLILDNEIFLGCGPDYVDFCSWLKFDGEGKYLSHGSAET